MLFPSEEHHIVPVKPGWECWMDTLVCRVSACLSYSSSYLWKKKVVSESKGGSVPCDLCDGGDVDVMVPWGGRHFLRRLVKETSQQKCRVLRQTVLF